MTRKSLSGTSGGGRLLLLAAFFYGLMTLCAVAWNYLRGRTFAFSGIEAWESLALGILAAAGTFGLGLAAYRMFPGFRRLAEELSLSLVSGVGRGSLLVLAVLSGVGEEVFFRGAVQAEFGIVVSSLLFGALHLGPGRRFVLWGLWAVAAGFLFGFLFDLSGGLLAPVAAHALHNAATLLFWKSRGLRRGETSG